MERGQRFNDAIVELCVEADLPQMWTSGVGLEGIEAGAASFLQRKDWIWSTYRSITASLAKGLDPRIWLKNNLGRVSKHQVGNIHKPVSTNYDNNTFANGNISPSHFETLNPHTGVDNDGNRRVIVYLFGDSSVRPSDLIEWMKESCEGKLPIVWVYVNKPGSPMFSSEGIGACISHAFSTNGHRLPEIFIDGRDAVAVARSVQNAADRARRGKGPSLINARLFRANGYPNRSIVHRSNAWGGGENGRNRDPIKELRKGLLNRRMATMGELRALETEIAIEVSEVFQWALKSFVR
jgi:TPP-dependent pyruvate/acetoin dehydrogenase alpha subunit